MRAATKSVQLVFGLLIVSAMILWVVAMAQMAGRA